MLNLDIRSFHQLAASAGRNHRHAMRELVVAHQHAAQGNEESIKRLLKQYDRADDPDKVVKKDQAAFIARMSGLR